MRKTIALVSVLALGAGACEDAVTAPGPVPVPAVATFDVNLTPTGEALFGTSAVFPSTNDANFNKAPTKWSHVLLVSSGVGQVTLNFVQPRNFSACFEYRIDDEAPTSTANGGNNYNTLVTDGMWLFTCRVGSSGEMTFNAAHHVDIRSAFGAESDERFNWTRFYVTPLDNKDQCKKGGWEPLGFRNLGQCIRYVETGKDSRTGG